MAARQTATALAGPSRLAARSLARSYATESAAPTPEASTSAPAVAIDVAPSKSGMRWAPSAGLPMAVAPLHPGPRVRSRYREHYDTTLASDLLYLTYDHALARDGPTAPARPAWDPLDPYTVGRKAPTLPGGAALVPVTHPVTAESVVQLESVTVSMHEPAAIRQKSSLMPVLAALSAMTGQPMRDPRVHGKTEGPGIMVTLTSRNARRHGTRPGVPCGGKVTLRGAEMATFVETLVEVVMPRLRTFEGVRMPVSASPDPEKDAASWSGSMSLSLPKEAVPLFPQIEANVHQYPRLSAFQVNFHTNARGEGAQDRARALLSGLRIPVRPRFWPR